MHEGNAQGFRMITRSMGWRQLGGLNLSAATLGAFGKYPFPLVEGGKKYGIHHADMETMAFVAQATGMVPEANGWRRHPLAWLMEAADDICYLTVDLEDAALMGLVGVEDLCDLYSPIIGADEIRRGWRMDDVPRMIQYLRSRMIKTLINDCVEIYADIADDLDAATLTKTPYGSGILAHTRHAQAMQAIRDYSQSQIYKSLHTQNARRKYRTAMISALTSLCEEFSDFLDRGDGDVLCDTLRDYPTLSHLPTVRLRTHVPNDPAEAYPWLLDQVTLMSDAQILALSHSCTTKGSR